MAMPLQGIYGGNYTYYTDNKPADYVKLLTDRLLYRPGQTVYVKGIAYEQQLDTANVLGENFGPMSLVLLLQILHCPLPV